MSDRENVSVSLDNRPSCWTNVKSPWPVLCFACGMRDRTTTDDSFFIAVSGRAAETTG